jgi:excisionase family DNA binding protein
MAANLVNLIGLAKASQQLGVSVYTLRRLAETGALRTVTVGARRLVPTSEIERIVANGIGKPKRKKDWRKR